MATARSSVGDDPPLDAVLRDAVAARLRDDAEMLAERADRPVLRRAVARALAAEGVVAAPDAWARLVRDLVDELGGLGPLERLLRDPAVTDVMVTGREPVVVERDGELEATDVRFDDDAHLLTVVRRAIGPLGVRLDRRQPFADATLPNGVRLHVLIPPLADHPVVTLRRVPALVPDWDALIGGGSVSASVVEVLREAVAARRNVVVCGRAGAGKTTMLSRLLADVGDERVIVIEDAPELRPPIGHVVCLRTRPPSAEGVGAVSVAQLVRNALRMRPDRLVVGEVRGDEVADLLQAMNTGHDGSMTTVHANGADEALVRLEGMALLAGVPLAAARAQLAAAVDLVVVLERASNGRRHVSGLAEVVDASGRPRTRAVEK
jgi:pilus assembly protein CpaF